MNLIEELSELGINTKQAKIYIALLQLGSASAIEIAKYTHLTHPTVYDVIDALKDKNLVSEFLDGNRKKFSAESPECIERNEKKRQTVLNKILPNLQELYAGGNRRPKMRFYSGSQANMIVHEELLSVKAKEYFYFGSVQEMFARNSDKELKDFYKRRIASGIRSNAIRNPSKESTEDYMQGSEKNLRRVRYLPEPISEDVAGLYIYDNKIAIISAIKENYAVIIESNELNILMKTIWQCLWQVARESI